MTACPVCGSSGLNFYYTSGGLAGEPGAADDAPAMLICRTCDEAFVPEYPRKCEWCGHDFGTGTEIESVGEPIEMMSGRVMATVVALAALLMGVAVYFALMF